MIILSICLTFCYIQITCSVESCKPVTSWVVLHEQETGQHHCPGGTGMVDWVSNQKEQWTIISSAHKRKQPLQLQQWPALTSSAQIVFSWQENKASAGLRSDLVTSLGWLIDLSGRPPLLVKQPSRVACIMEELKCWGAWNTPHKQQSPGHHTINHLEERGVEWGST